MTRKEIDAIFQEYGQYATGKDYALVHAIAKTVAAQKCVCGEPNSSGTHRTDGPCLAPQPEQEPVIGTKTWFEDGKVVTQHLTAKDIYKDPEQPEQEPATKEQIREAMIFNLPLYTMPPHPDQEPVAWLGFNERGECREVFTREMKKTLPNYPTEGMTPVYTTPPQRTWVGLTPFEIDEIIEDAIHPMDALLQTMDKLKEKNT